MLDIKSKLNKSIAPAILTYGEDSIFANWIARSGAKYIKVCFDWQPVYCQVCILHFGYGWKTLEDTLDLINIERRPLIRKHLIAPCYEIKHQIDAFSSEEQESFEEYYQDLINLNSIDIDIVPLTTSEYLSLCPLES